MSNCEGFKEGMFEGFMFMVNSKQRLAIKDFKRHFIYVLEL